MVAVLAVFGKVYHPRVCKKTEKDRDSALDEEHPPPTTEAIMAIEVIESKVYNEASGWYEYFARLEKSESKLLFFVSVPSADKTAQTKVDLRHRDAEEDA
jgi:hypothetical protein